MKKFPIEKLPRWMQELIRPDVIKAMQIKFVATAMGILIMVFIIMLSSINMIMKTVSQSQSMELLTKIADSERYNTLNEDDRPLEDIPPPDGQFPPPDDQFVPPSESETITQAEIEIENIQPLALTPENDWYRWYYEEYAHKKWDDQKPPKFDDDYDDDNFEDFKDFDDEDWEEYWNSHDVPPWEREQWETQQWETENNPPPDEQNHQPVQEETPPPETPPAVTEIPAAAEPVQPPEENHPTEVPPPPEEPSEMPSAPPEETAESLTDAPVSDSETEPSASETETTETTETASESVTESAPQETPPPKPDGENPDNNQRNNNNNFRMEMRPNKWKVNIVLDHFALMADADGNFLGIRNTENYTDEEAEEIMSAILSTGKQQGMYGWLQYYKAEKEYGTLLVVTDKTSDQGLLNNLFRTTVIAGVVVLLILFAFLVFFSRWITQPVKTAMERQKQFVSDASHELKTPIAVLTANVDILQDEIGENKWLSYIQEQTVRMNQLVGDLLRLARMDNATQEYVFQEFNLSTAIEATALPFESQAFEKHKNLEIDIQPDVTYTGSEQHIRQLAAIFIDNAMKYSNEHGTIKISLIRRGDNRILEFYNTGCEISQEETDKIFERFYRGDKARNNKGKNGYGLGLAIAKSIMEIHKIKIQVTCEQGAWIRFLMTL
ncbi:MAG: HAMP domain-containing histidine kinase [Oscillospiraceae bacterium]|nr:HAMP domain-containing histidine kinase [Oscillospiraceae bacterium]